MHNQDGIFTNNIKITKINTEENNSKEIFGGVGCIDMVSDVDKEEAPGVALYYGSEASQWSTAMYKVNGNNLGFKWNDSWMSLNTHVLDTGLTTELDQNDWFFNGVGKTYFRIKDMKKIEISTVNQVTPNEVGDSSEPPRIYISTSGVLDGEVYISASNGIIQLTAKSINFNTPTAENQTGIYARFA